MDSAPQCECPEVNINSVIPRKEKTINFHQLNEVLGGGNLGWFDDLSKVRGYKDAEVATPSQTDSPAIPKQNVTPGLGSLTPLTAWALLSSQDPTTSTPASVDGPIVVNRLNLPTTTNLTSTLKTCVAIRAHLGLSADDSNLSWSNSMATPFLGGDAQISQDYPISPASKPKGLSRALFSPGLGDCDELVKALSVTADEEGLSPARCAATSPLTPDLRRNAMKESFRRFASQIQSMPELDEETLLEGDLCTSKEKQYVKKPSNGFDNLSPVLKCSTPKTVGQKMKEVLVQSLLVSNIVREDTNDQCSNNEHSETAVESGHKNDTKSNFELDSKQNDQRISSPDKKENHESSTSPLLNRRVRNNKAVKHTPENEVCETRKIVSKVLADFMDSPSNAKRRSPPRKGKKRKSNESPLIEDSNVCMPSPHQSQVGTIQSILSSSKKRKTGSSRKRVRFAKKLYEREGEAPTVAKRLEYVPNQEPTSLSQSPMQLANSNEYCDTMSEIQNSVREVTMVIARPKTVSLEMPEIKTLDGEDILFESQDNVVGRERQLKFLYQVSSKKESSDIPDNAVQETGYINKGVLIEYPEKVSEKITEACDVCDNESGKKLLGKKNSIENISEISTNPVFFEIPSHSLSKSCNSTSKSEALEKKPGDEFFSQVSPSSLREMCLVASSADPIEEGELTHPHHHILQDESSCGHTRDMINSENKNASRVTNISEAEDTCNDITKTDTFPLGNTDIENEALEVHCQFRNNSEDKKTKEPRGGTLIETSSSYEETSADIKTYSLADKAKKIPQNITPRSNERQIQNDVGSVPTKTSIPSSTSLHETQNQTETLKPKTLKLPFSGFEKKSKAKRFVYPTSSQIEEVCPETVFKFHPKSSHNLSRTSTSETTMSTETDLLIQESKETICNKVDSKKKDVIETTKDKDLTCCDSKIQIDSSRLSMEFQKFSEMFDDGMDDREVTFKMDDETGHLTDNRSQSGTKEPSSTFSKVLSTQEVTSLKLNSSPGYETCVSKCPSTESLIGDRTSVKQSTTSKKHGCLPGTNTFSVTPSEESEDNLLDVPEELFTDIEFSPTENKVATFSSADVHSDATCISMEKSSFETSNVDDVKRNTLKSGVSGPSEVARANCDIDEKHVFRVPPVPHKKNSTLSDSDTDSLLSDMELSEQKHSHGPTELFKQRDKISNENERGMSEEELQKDETRDDNKISFPVSESNTDMYVTSTEETKEGSYNEKAVPRIKLPPRTRSTRKPSQMLTRTQLMCDSDSDTLPVTRNRKGRMGKKLSHSEAPEVVSDTNPLVVWDDVQVQSSHRDVVSDGRESETYLRNFQDLQNRKNVEKITMLNNESCSVNEILKSGEMKLFDQRKVNIPLGSTVKQERTVDCEVTFKNENDIKFDSDGSSNIGHNNCVSDRISERNNNHDGIQKTIVGFTTAAGNIINLDQRSLETASELLQNSIKPSEKSIRGNSIENHQGLLSASRKPFEIDFQSSLKSCVLSDNVCDLSAPNIEKASELETSNIGIVDHMAEHAEFSVCWEKRENPVSKAESSRTDFSKSVSQFVGFSTASGKKLELNPELMQKAGNMFDNDSYIQPAHSPKQIRDVSQIEIPTHVMESDLSTSSSPAFSTASGKNLVMNEFALKQAKGLLTLNEMRQIPKNSADSPLPVFGKNDHESFPLLTKTHIEEMNLKQTQQKMSAIQNSADQHLHVSDSKQNSQNHEEGLLYEEHSEDLESLLGSLLKNKKKDFFKKSESLQGNATNMMAAEKRHIDLKANSNSEELFVSKLGRDSKNSIKLGFQSSSKGISSCFQTSRANIDPMLKPKGFRPFKKPRTVQKSKSFDPVILVLDSSGQDSGNGCAEHVSTTVIPEADKMDKVLFKSNSDLSDNLLIEFSKDMTELSQTVRKNENKTEPEKIENFNDSGILQRECVNISDGTLDIKSCSDVNESERKSDMHLNLMDVLFDGDMSSQLEVMPVSTASASTHLLSLEHFRDRIDNVPSKLSNMKSRLVIEPSQLVSDRVEQAEIKQSKPGCGFQTASGRSVSVSEKGAAAAKMLLDDPTNDMVFKRLTSSSGKDLCQPLPDKQSVSLSLTTLQRYSIHDDSSESSVSVSEMVLSLPKSLFEDKIGGDRIRLLSKVKMTSESDTESSTYLCQTALPQVKENCEKVKSMCEEKDTSFFHAASGAPSGNQAPSFFHPASGSRVTVSDKALAQGKKLLATDEAPSCNQATSLFQTASGSIVTVSGKALAHGKKLWATDEAPSCDQAPSLFQTASGSRVTVSGKALAQGKKLWETDEAPSGDQAPSLFQTASGSKVTVSCKALAQGKKLWETDEAPSCNQAPSLFQTASGSKVTVTGKALAQGKKLWETDEAPSCNQAPSLFQTASGSIVTVSGKALAQGKKLWETDEAPSCNQAPSLFQTVSGSKVTVSGKALAHGKKLWKTNEAPSCNQAPSLFQTASGSIVTVSGKALTQGKKLWETDEAPSCNQAPSLFQTASGSIVTVSGKALAQGKKLWETGETPSCNQAPSLFQTASGSIVTVSGKALAQGKKLWETDEAPSCNQAPSLFQTASGSKVTDSGKALAQGKKLWETDEAPSCNQAPSLFQTASGSKVTVSGKALAQGKKLWETDEAPSCNQAPSLFQTASGSKVTVSGKALAQGKKLWETDEAPSGIKASGSKICVSMAMRGDTLNSGNTCTVVNKDSGFSNTLTGSKAIGTSSHHDKVDDFRVPEYSAEVMQKMATETWRSSYNKSLQNVYKHEKTSVLSTPERMYLDRRIGRRLTPVQSTSLTSRASEYTVEAVTCKMSANTAQNAASTFRTPYTNTMRRLVQTATPQERAPVFKPKVTLKTKHNFDQRFPVSQNSCYKLEEFDGVSSSKNELSACSDEAEEKNPVDRIKTSGVVEEDKQVVPDVGEEELFTSKVVDHCLSHLVAARKNQGEIIERKKKQKIRPCRGRLLIEKSSRQTTMQYQELLRFEQRIQKTSSVGLESFSVGSCNAEDFRFRLLDFYPSSHRCVLVGDGAELIPDDLGLVGKEQFYSSFLTLEGVDPKLTSDLWVFNHYRWIVWKLAAYEVTFPTQFGARCLTPDNVMLQLKYRYDREVDSCHRSAIKKMVERDDAACKRLVLCVAGVDKSRSTGESSISERVLELTDGWYSIKAKLDVGLEELVERRRILIGQKLCISGAELIGSHDACPPLEIPDSLFLKICLNSTRPASWYCRLGYQSDPRPLCVPISTLHSEGGVVGCVDGVVTRIYPLMYMEKLADGGTVFRSEDAEEKVRREFAERKERAMERLYSELQAGMEKEREGRVGSRARQTWTERQIEDLTSGQDIHEAVEASLQPEELLSWLSLHQREQLEKHQRDVHEKYQQQLRDKLHKAWQESQQEKSSRTVTPVMKLRLSSCSKKDIDSKISSIVSVWRPTPEWMSLQEGGRYKIFAMTAAPARTRLESHSVHLTVTRQTRLQPRPLDENYLDLLFEPREVWRVRELQMRTPPCKEFDFVGMVVSHHVDSVRNSFTVVVTDISGDTMNIRFWGSLQSYGAEEQLAVGRCFVAVNLILKFTQDPISADVSHEVTRFSSSARHTEHKKALAQLSHLPQVEKTRLIETAKSRRGSHGRPVPNIPEHSTSPERVFTDLPSECLQRLFSPMEEGLPKGDNSTSDSIAKKRRAILREKSSKLMSYGSPKPLSSLPIQVSPAVDKAFKSPFNPSTF